MKKNFMKKILIIVIMLAIIGIVVPTPTQTILASPEPKIIYRGHASWYSFNSPGINDRTANNERFDENALTCAMWGVEFNSTVKVTNLSNGKSVIVRVNDRGPHRRFVRKGRLVDLTKHAFKQIGNLKHGLVDVQIELL